TRESLSHWAGSSCPDVEATHSILVREVTPVYTAMLVDFFGRLPHRVVRSSGSMALGQYEEREGGRSSRSSAPHRSRGGAALEAFRKRVLEKYNEGTLLRLLESGDVKTRRAAAFTLGLLGTMENANAALAAALHDDDNEVRRLAGDALWSVWFGAD